jgi:DNA-binding MarR family transcriptional regulator
MKTSISYVDKSEIFPEAKDADVCAQCRSKGLNLCDIDEICQIRLAAALGEDRPSIDASVDYAKKKGLIEVREIKGKGDRPRRFIKITDQGKMFFALMK